MPSNNVRRRFAVPLFAALAACAHQTAPPSEATPASDGRVAYVMMDRLVRVHPLYSQLARLDEDVQALQLKSVGSDIARSGADIAKEELALQRELDAAADRTKKALQGKQQEYARREQAAIDAALGAAGSAGGPGGATIAAGIAAQSRVQAHQAASAAQHNFDVYREALLTQDENAARSLQASLGERANRTYRASAEQLQKKEADFALQEASGDAAERLSLRTKLSNLALDDASRADVKKQLDDLDRREGDALAAMKNRDQATLAALQQELHTSLQRELGRQVAQLHARTLAKINDRELVTRKALVAQIGLPPTSGMPASAGGVAPDMRAKLLALHQKYQGDFNKDASRTVAQFTKTRADLSRRFAALSGVDSGAQAGTRKQIDALQKQRGDLYDEMVAQIGREVKAIAQKRGLSVVVSGIVAPAGGVDLTADAEKDIESLHE